MAQKIVAANWKMNFTEVNVADFFEEFLAGLRSDWLDHLDIVIFPQILHLALVRERVKDRISWGAQNVHAQPKGAFTGETSPKALADFGAEFVLVGHSERRQMFSETDEIIAAKVESVRRYRMKPILCIGETLEERESERTHAVLEKQLTAVLSKIKNFKGAVAYEPVWAIGTGKTAKPNQVENAHEFIRSIVGNDISILYGGSVKPSNAVELAQIKNVDGFLVGGASLVPKDFISIIKAMASGA